MPLDSHGRSRPRTKGERAQEEIESAYLRQRDVIAKKAIKDSYDGTVTVEEPSDRLVVCRKHGYSPPSLREGLVVEAWAAASQCPECERERQDADARRLAPRPTVVLPHPAENFKRPTALMEEAYDKWISDNKEELLRTRPHLVNRELERAATDRMDETHLAAKRSDRLTVEEKAERRHRSYVKHWAKRIARGTDPSLTGLPPRSRDENEVVIEIEGEDGHSVVYDPYDNWDRNADSRSFLTKWLDDERRSRWMPRRATPSEERAESLVTKIGDAIRSVLSEPAQEDTSG
jgi:hypothetical protein